MLFNLIPSNDSTDSIIFPESIYEVGNFIFGEMYYLMSSILPDWSMSASGIPHNTSRVGMAFKIEYSKLGDIIWEIFKFMGDNLQNS